MAKASRVAVRHSDSAGGEVQSRVHEAWQPYPRAAESNWPGDRQPTRRDQRCESNPAIPAQRDPYPEVVYQLIESEHLQTPSFPASVSKWYTGTPTREAWHASGRPREQICRRSEVQPARLYPLLLFQCGKRIRAGPPFCFSDCWLSVGKAA